MPSKNRGTKRCEFCNSASHTMYNCNSNMNGRRDYLNKGWDCMLHDICPDFGVLHANELRYVAYHFAQYEKAIIYCSNKKTTQHYNQKFRLRPIPLSLSKKQMIHALVQRWNGFQSVRDLYKNPPSQVDDDDCPICLESLAWYKWSYETASWKKDCITTVCKHRFCIECWDSHIQKNYKHSFVHKSIKIHVCCPMCRHEIEIK